MMDSGDIKWLAGLLEGEGCFSIDCRMNSRYVRNPSIYIFLRMTDRDVVERAKNIMDPLDHYKLGTQMGEVSEFYRFNIIGSRAVQWIMTLYSLMGKRRKKKMKEILDQWKILYSLERMRNTSKNPYNK